MIENRPGAGGATGTKSVAGAEPDGYTLLIGTSATLGVVPALVKSPGYDPIKSFAPVAKVADSTLVLVAPALFPARTVQEFVAYAKANPGKLSYASAGAGNQTQLLAELFKSKAGIDVLHVPYKSGAEMVTAVLGEQVHMAFPDISILVPSDPRGEAQGARRHQRGAPPAIARCAHHGGKRHCGFRHDVLERRHGARRNAGERRRQAQRGDQRRRSSRKPMRDPRCAKVGATPPIPALAAGFCPLHRGRDRERMGARSPRPRGSARIRDRGDRRGSAKNSW